MALPSDGSPCEISDDVCCNVIFDIADHLLTEIGEALALCFEDDSCCTAPAQYITFGFGDDGIRDALTVAIQQVAPSPVTSQGKGGVTVPIGLYRCIYEIRLRESGWPLVHIEGDAIVPPDPVRQRALARHAFSHGEMMYRKIRSLYANGEITPSTLPQRSNAIIGPLLPLNPLGGVVGFTCTVQIDIPWNWTA